MDAVSRTPVPVNEPVRQYQPGSHERAVLESKIKELAGQRTELTMTIGGTQQMATGEQVDVVQPHNKAHVLGQLGHAADVDVAAAIYAAKHAAPELVALGAAGLVAEHRFVAGIRDAEDGVGAHRYRF